MADVRTRLDEVSESGAILFGHVVNLISDEGQLVCPLLVGVLNLLSLS